MPKRGAGSNYSSVTQDRGGAGQASSQGLEKSCCQLQPQMGSRLRAHKTPNRPRSQWRWSWCRAALLGAT